MFEVQQKQSIIQEQYKLHKDLSKEIEIEIGREREKERKRGEEELL